MVEHHEGQKRLIASVGYVFTPIVPLIALTSGLRDDPFVRRHAAQALIWTIGFILLIVLVTIMAIAMIRASWVLVCLLPLLFALPFLPGLIWARQVYNGRDVRLPLITPLASRILPPR